MEEQKISLKQLVEIRKEEMKGMLPGLMTEVTDGSHSVMVFSPDPEDRSHFRMKEDGS